MEKQNAEGGFLQPDGTRVKLDVKDVMMSSWRRSGVRALMKCKDGSVFAAMYQGRWLSLKVFRLYAENEENPLDDAQQMTARVRRCAACIQRTAIPPRAGVIVKLTLVCKMPRGALLRSLRRLVFGAATRSVHGNPPHKPGFHLQHILRWVQYGELYGVRALVIQAELVHPRRAHGVCVTELDDTPEEELQQAERRQRLASEAFDQCSTERRAVRQRVASEVSQPQVGTLRRL